MKNKWEAGLRFVQWQKNNRLHTGIGRSPYQAMFGERHKSGKAQKLPKEIWETLETEEELEKALNEEEKNRK